MTNGIIRGYGPIPIRPNGWYRLGDARTRHWWEYDEKTDMFRTLCKARVLGRKHQMGLRIPDLGTSRQCQQCQTKKYNGPPIFPETV